MCTRDAAHAASVLDGIPCGDRWNVDRFGFPAVQPIQRRKHEHVECSRGKNRSDDGYLVNRLNDYLNLNRTLLWDDSLDKTVSTLTPSTVNAAMKKWIIPGDITIVQAGDFK